MLACVSVRHPPPIYRAHPRQAHKFTANEELRAGADLWHEDREAAFARYGPMSDWDVSDITSMSYLFGGWQLARGALVAANLSANSERVVFCDRKVNTAQFYMERLLPRARAHAGAIDAPGESLVAFSHDWF